MKNSALVVIDLQNDITKNYKEIIPKVNEAIDWAVQKELWVVYIQHNNLSAGTGTFKPGTHGAEFVPEMNVVSDYIFTKSKSSALTNEEFAAFIQENGINEFYLAGADAAACIKSTCYNMTKSGYTVHVLSDCITSYDKKKLPEMLAYYENKGCSVMTLQEAMQAKSPKHGGVNYKKISYQKNLTAYYDSEGLLKQYPSKKPLRLIALTKIAVCLEYGRKYSEKEVNEIIRQNISFSDIELIRREMFQYKLIGRLKDGSEYWREEVESAPRP